ncbi:large conductance mechanosensitive channel protein MscL [Oceanisphaera avium]|uniref:Large-conductance mechanosensitive channel n=1 Tax=Oceanisphaera avium TaxID=1903694 RepID=A0A1Y0CZV2_9GAMM|nr:large conductance mechanosensitive channel protein MscL [Oceanisphaera avium]ART80863.1 large-conductance mechanosensitive channel protein [Oceanisphaera avium]
MAKKNSFFREFRQFAVKGNMIDLAVGVIIGGAFSKIIDSLVRDVFMPVINFILGGDVDFSNKLLVLRAPQGYTGSETQEALSAAGAIVLYWGNFVTVFINFILLAFVVFIMVKMINRMRQSLHHEEKTATVAPAPPPEDIQLLREIRDALQDKSQPPVK